MPTTIPVGARSLFVTATAWLFIVIGLGASAWSLVQHAHVASLLPDWQAASRARPLPALTALLFGYLPVLLWAGLALSLATLASAIGLLLRLDWARRAFIGVLAVAILANLAGLWVQHELVQSVVATTIARTAMPPDVLDMVGRFVTAARVMAACMTLVACLLMAWIIRALMSPRVRQEFA